MSGGVTTGVLQLSAIDDGQVNPIFVLCGNVNDSAVNLQCSTQRWNMDYVGTTNINGQSW